MASFVRDFYAVRSSVLGVVALIPFVLSSAVLGGCKDPPVLQAQVDAAPKSSASAAWEMTIGPIPETKRDPLDATAAVQPRLDGGDDTSLAMNGGAGQQDGGDPLDGGAPLCRRVRGPEKMPFVGPAKLVVVGQELRLVTNDSGRPKVTAIPALAPPKVGEPIPDLPPPPSSTYGVTWPPCAVAGAFAICPGRSGSVTRTALSLSPPKEIAKGRPSTRVAAAQIGGHSIAGYLDEKQTTEGRTLHAFVVLDEGEPVRLSDEGSGATDIELFSRGSTIVAMYLDVRAAMVPVHERTITLKNGAIDLARDVVVAVGGAPERGVSGRIGASSTSTFFVIPMPEDALYFGMATLKLSDPPREEEKVSFSRYPNGLDPAPLAATTGGATIRVARVRPLDSAATSSRAVELGTLGEDGAFTSQAILHVTPKNKPITDLDIVDDAFGATWILYGDSSDTWLERRVCR